MPLEQFWALLFRHGVFLRLNFNFVIVRVLLLLLQLLVLPLLCALWL